jgi:two-component system chemotaxis sensor kinase CheA
VTIPDVDDDIVGEFLVESHENLDQLDRDLVALEKDPTSPGLLASVFRTVHTLKGVSGLLSFGRLEALTHAGESLLARLRDGHVRLDAETTTALLALVDAVRALLAAIERDGAEPDPGEPDTDHRELIETLGRLQSRPQDDSPPMPRVGQLLVELGLATSGDVTLALAAQDAGDDRRIGEILVAEGIAAPQEVTEALAAQADGRRSAADSTVRVDVGLLDSLMGLVAELAAVREDIAQSAVTGHDTALLYSTARLDAVVRALHEGVFRTRMQPVDTVWSRVPRVVRNLSVVLGKSVALEADGAHVEVDRTILDAVRDPLTHLVRNAVDHGIEPAAVRVAAGKPAEGSLRLLARQEGGEILLEIADDGAGIDPARVRARAVADGLLGADDAARLDDREVLDLIFAPGFSTAESVTTVSGRGVGMDVVRTNIERVGGRIDVSSSLGGGTTVRLRFPAAPPRAVNAAPAAAVVVV